MVLNFFWLWTCWIALSQDKSKRFDELVNVAALAKMYTCSTKQIIEKLRKYTTLPCLKFLTMF
jgi:hypothetical protein